MLLEHVWCVGHVGRQCRLLAHVFGCVAVLTGEHIQLRYVRNLLSEHCTVCRSI